MLNSDIDRFGVLSKLVVLDIKSHLHVLLSLTSDVLEFRGFVNPLVTEDSNKLDRSKHRDTYSPFNFVEQSSIRRAPVQGEEQTMDPLRIDVSPARRTLH